MFELFCRDKSLFYKIAGNNTLATTAAELEDSYIETLINKENLSDFNLWFETLASKDTFIET